MLLTVKNPVANIYKKIIEILKLLLKFFWEKILNAKKKLVIFSRDIKLTINIKVLLKLKIYT